MVRRLVVLMVAVFAAGLLFSSQAICAPEGEGQGDSHKIISGNAAESEEDALNSKENQDLTAQEIRDMAKQYAQEKLDNMTYAEPTYMNISKLYWAIGVFDPENDPEAVDKYLMINECQIYNQYYNDDFEWKQIHQATVDYLKENRASFPKTFQFMREVRLGRYDFDKQAFYVLDEDLSSGARNYSMNDFYQSDDVCNQRASVAGYPRDLTLSLSRPFRMSFVPVGPTEAQNFIARSTYSHQERLSQNASEDRVRSSYERVVYLKVRVRFVKFLKFFNVTAGKQSAMIFAVLEGYDVYEDSEGKKLLFSTRG